MLKIHYFKIILILILMIHPAALYAGQYTVIRVNDGDTITALTRGKEIKIHLVGIDAPELSIKKHIPGQPFSLMAKEYLASLVLNKGIAIKFYSKDQRGRSLGEVFVDELNINLEMIKAGLAEVYRGKVSKNHDIATYQEAERKAKENIRGIWELRDQYFSPMDWREMYGIDE